MGHIALRHLDASDAVVDMEDPAQIEPEDEEETSADKYALELLTGESHLQIEANVENFSAAQLADAVMVAGRERSIEPGTLALCMGYQSRKWAQANAALKLIYAEAKPVWREVNMLAANQLDWTNIGAESSDYLRAVMATPDVQ